MNFRRNFKLDKAVVVLVFLTNLYRGEALTCYTCSGSTCEDFTELKLQTCENRTVSEGIVTTASSESIDTSTTDTSTTVDEYTTLKLGAEGETTTIIFEIGEEFTTAKSEIGDESSTPKSETEDQSTIGEPETGNQFTTKGSWIEYQSTTDEFETEYQTTINPSVTTVRKKRTTSSEKSSNDNWRCYKIVEIVDGRNSVRRGCVEINKPFEPKAPVVYYETCVTDKCNSATNIGISIVLMLITLGISFHHS